MTPLAEEIVLGCLFCPYEAWAHIDGRCPDEHEAAEYYETRRQRRLRAQEEEAL